MIGCFLKTPWRHFSPSREKQGRRAPIKSQCRHLGNGGKGGGRISERIANVAEFKAMKDVGKAFLGNGGSVGKHDTYPPRLDLAYADEERLPPAEIVLRREQRS